MDYLKINELERLQALLSEFSGQDSKKPRGTFKRVLTTQEKRGTLNMLRSKFPDLFSGLEEINLNDDRSLLKFLSNPLNRNKIRERVLKQLPVEQQLELAEALKESGAEEEAGGQPPPQTEGAETMQSQAEAAGEHSVPSTGPGLPSAPSAPSTPRSVRYAPPPPQTPKPEIAVANEQTLSKFQSGWKSMFKSGFSNAGIFFKKASIKLGSALLSTAGSFGRAATAPLAPIASGGGNLFIRGLNSGISARQGFLNRVANARRAAGTARSSAANIGKSQGRLFFIGIFSLMFLTGAIAAFAPSPEGQPIAIAGPVTAPITPTGDIASCQFIRSDREPKAAPFKSSLLLSYFQEVAAKTSVPATLLAAVARVETPGSSDWTNDNINSQPCPESEDGALGIMQIVSHFSPRTDAICKDCIKQGAGYLGKTVDQLTREDYCNPRSSIYLGAGFILKKLSYLKIGDGTKWDPAWTNDKSVIDKVASSFYGCIKYGGNRNKCDDPANIHSYGDDIYDSIQNCKTTAIASCPVPNGVISKPSYQAGRGSGKNNGHCDGGYGYTCNCGTSGRRAKAIDVPTNGQSVVLPKIENQDVNWQLIVGPYSVDSQEGGGFGYTFQTTLGSNIYYLDMLHLNQSALTKGSNYLSGTPIAISAISHVHMTVGKNLSKFPVAGSDTDCDPNWLASDFMCK